MERSSPGNSSAGTWSRIANSRRHEKNCVLGIWGVLKYGFADKRGAPGRNGAGLVCAPSGGQGNPV